MRKKIIVLIVLIIFAMPCVVLVIFKNRKNSDKIYSINKEFVFPENKIIYYKHEGLFNSRHEFAVETEYNSAVILLKKFSSSPKYTYPTKNCLRDARNLVNYGVKIDSPALMASFKHDNYLYLISYYLDKKIMLFIALK
jgi:hypothetical protein